MGLEVVKLKDSCLHPPSCSKTQTRPCFWMARVGVDACGPTLLQRTIGTVIIAVIIKSVGGGKLLSSCEGTGR